MHTIQPGSPAAKSELHAGDVVTSVDSKAVVTSEQLKAEVRSKKVGQQVTLDVFRNGKNIKVKVKTDAFPETATLVSSKRTAVPEDSSRDLGLTVRTLTRELADQFGIERVSQLDPKGVSEARAPRAFFDKSSE